MTKVAPGVLLLRVPSIGELDACDVFDRVVGRAIACRPRMVVVDLSDAESVSTVMLGLLMKLRHAVVPMGGQVRLAAVGPMVLSVLSICRLDRLFTIHHSLEEAMEDVTG
jgi:anti-anti-sigma factor